MLHFQLKQKWELQKQLNIYIILFLKRENRKKDSLFFYAYRVLIYWRWSILMLEADLSMEPTFFAK